MRTRFLLGIAALLGALIAALTNGWTPRAGLDRSSGRDSLISAAVTHPALAAPPSGASADAPDFTTRGRAVLAMPRDRRRADTLRALIAEWIAVNPLACLAFLEETAANDPMRASLSNFAIERWLGRDETRARDWVLARVRSDDRLSEFYLQPVFAWDERRGSFPALLDRLRELPTTENIYAPLTRVVASAIIFKNDQDAAVAFIREVPYERARGSYWQMLGSELARKNGVAILNQLAGDGTIDGFPPEVGGGAVSSLLRTDLAATSRWLAQQPDAPTWDGARFNQGIAEMQASPERSVETAARITDEQRRNQLTRDALSIWAGRDYAAATDWAANSSLPIELVAEALVRGQVIRDPAHYQRALNAAAARAHDEKTRVRGQFVILQSWLAVDRTSARQWIAASNLPADAKQVLLDINP